MRRVGKAKRRRRSRAPGPSFSDPQEVVGEPVDQLGGRSSETTGVVAPNRGGQVAPVDQPGRCVQERNEQVPVLVLEAPERVAHGLRGSAQLVLDDAQHPPLAAAIARPAQLVEPFGDESPNPLGREVRVAPRPTRRQSAAWRAPPRRHRGSWRGETGSASSPRGRIRSHQPEPRPAPESAQRRARAGYAEAPP